MTKQFKIKESASDKAASIADAKKLKEDLLKKKSMKKTIKEALEEGYTLCGDPDLEWQSLTSIDELDEEDFEDQVFFLADKKEKIHVYSKESIAETLADIISNEEAEDTGRDDDAIYKAIKKIDFSETEKKIENVLKTFGSYGITDIQLIP